MRLMMFQMRMRGLFPSLPVNCFISRLLTCNSYYDNFNQSTTLEIEQLNNLQMSSAIFDRLPRYSTDFFKNLNSQLQYSILAQTRRRSLGQPWYLTDFFEKPKTHCRYSKLAEPDSTRSSDRNIRLDSVKYLSVRLVFDISGVISSSPAADPPVLTFAPLGEERKVL